MSKLTEEDIKLRYITPSVQQAGWDKTQFRMEYYFTDGQVLVRGKVVQRGARKKADYILMSKSGNLPLAIIEAKDNEHSVGSGMQQAIEYARILDIPFAYSSNGDAFLEHDFFTGKEIELKLAEFPSEEDLWKRYLIGKNLDKKQEEIVSEPFHLDTFNPRIPRYYQRVAIQKTIEAIAKGQNRILLVMARSIGGNC